MAEVDGNLVGGAWSCYAKYSQSTNDTSSTITITGGMRSHGYGMNLSEVTCVVNQGGYTRSGSSSFYSPYNTWTDKDLCSYSDTWTRTHEDRTINCWAQIDRSSSSYRGGTSTAWLTFTVPAKPHWGVSYDANGGSCAPGDQTKWYGETLTLSSTRPTRTGYTFQGWATSSSGGVSYQPGASYTSNSGLTLYAVWKANTWTVSFDANGGSGAPDAQTKTYGQDLTLSSDVPTRALYNFKGWATSASSTAVAYQPGASYTTNDNVTLYAVWELAYVRPRITGVSVGRCDKDGKASDDGTYCAVTFSWETDHDVQAVGVSTGVGSYDYKSSGRSGAVSAVIGDGELSIERSYDVEITVSDDLGQSSVTRQIAPFSFVMDFAPNGSVAIGTVADDSERRLDIDIPMRFSDQASARASLGLAVGAGLSTDGTTLSVDNWAYVKKLVESSTEWAYIWSNAESSRFVRWRVLMGICYVEAVRVNGVGSGGWKAGTIPDSALPSDSLYTAACDWHHNNTAQIWVGGLSSTDSRGEVWLYNNGTEDVFGSVSWPIDM